MIQEILSNRLMPDKDKVDKVVVFLPLSWQLWELLLPMSTCPTSRTRTMLPSLLPCKVVHPRGFPTLLDSPHTLAMLLCPPRLLLLLAIQGANSCPPINLSCLLQQQTTPDNKISKLDPENFNVIISSLLFIILIAMLTLNFSMIAECHLSSPYMSQILTDIYLMPL